MKRLYAIAITAILAVVTLTGCGSTTNTFEERNGVCYRTRTEKTLGVTTYEQTTAAVPENCQ